MYFTLTGCPVYIWRVEPESLADSAGILSGDEILSANEIDFTQISHGEALKVTVTYSFILSFPSYYDVYCYVL
jgi:predicted metalloprotease with PDZ domain